MCNKCGKAAVETHIQTLEEIRDMLLKETYAQGEPENRSGFVNGILDFYNAVKNRQDKMLAYINEKEGK